MEVMKPPQVKALLLLSLLAAVGAVISAYAAGSHFELGFGNGGFHFDFRVATGDSQVSTVLELIALATGLAGLGIYLWQASHAGKEAGSGFEFPGTSGFSGFMAGLRRLAKSNKDAWLGGVCGGLGEHTPLPSWLWRLFFLVLLCFYGTGVLLYVLFWICLPEPAAVEEKPAASAGGQADTRQP